ncbi:mariner mos1 transposase [Plakobranchus ocellatus]|uniref:Mariner mos1 transposase n=1 Tax=Plakobranchus ocellatus TaxID=259542 RepID=A0AAV3YDT9_9GAST|nr:mariner mos1 transposase [Plakobranchus ocellatus]
MRLIDMEAPSSPVTKKFKVQQSATKMMATVFWDSREMILLDILPKGESFNADQYCEIIDRLRHAVRRKRPGLLCSRVVLQHDNETPHTAKHTKEWLEPATMSLQSALLLLGVLMISSPLAKANGGCCGVAERLEKATEEVELLEEGVEGAAKKLEEEMELVSDSSEKIHDLEARIQGLYTILSIHPLFYVPSAVYKNEKVYTLSRRNEAFNLEKMNNYCKGMGGYLAEIDDAEELEFVASKVASITRNLVYIGTNDVDEEGKYVQYNSKKPLPDGLKWKAGNPDNYGGDPGEDCVNLTVAGLNDLDCKRQARFICEIPIV